MGILQLFFFGNCKSFGHLGKYLHVFVQITGCGLFGEQVSAVNQQKSGIFLERKAAQVAVKRGVLGWNGNKCAWFSAQTDFRHFFMLKTEERREDAAIVVKIFFVENFFKVKMLMTERFFDVRIYGKKQVSCAHGVLDIDSDGHHGSVQAD